MKTNPARTVLQMSISVECHKVVKVTEIVVSSGVHDLIL